MTFLYLLGSNVHLGILVGSGGCIVCPLHDDDGCGRHQFGGDLTLHLTWDITTLLLIMLSDIQVAKKIKEKFLKEVSRVVVKVLDPFRRSDVKRGHIKTTEDFKHLAKKVS